MEFKIKSLLINLDRLSTYFLVSRFLFIAAILAFSFMTIRNLYLLLYCLIFEPESKSTCYEFA